MVCRSPPDNHIGMYSFTRLGPGCGDARVGETSKCFAHSTAYSIFTCKNSTGRSPIFILTFFRHFADRIIDFDLKTAQDARQILYFAFWILFASNRTFPVPNLIDFGTGKVHYFVFGVSAVP